MTARSSVVTAVKLPDVPVMVMVEVPATTVSVAVSVSVLALGSLTGLKAAVTPLGKPEAEKLTLELNPFCGVTVMVLVPTSP